MAALLDAQIAPTTALAAVAEVKIVASGGRLNVDVVSALFGPERVMLNTFMIVLRVFREAHFNTLTTAGELTIRAQIRPGRLRAGRRERAQIVNPLGRG